MMKKGISSLISLAMFIALVPLNVFAMSGNGTENSPHLVSTAQDILDIHDNLAAHYKMTNDIDMSGVDFEPIGNEREGAFTGSFDGNGYTIKNLTANNESNKYSGLFGYLDGNVHDISLIDTNISGYKYVGGIIGYASENSCISNCAASGNVEGMSKVSSTYAGGIVGYLDGNKISYCRSQILMSGNGENIGGICGYNKNGTVINCINNGKVLSSGYYIGGIVGQNIGIVDYCYNYGIIDGGRFVGGITGYNQGDINYCTNYSEINSGSNVGGISGYNKSKIFYSANNGYINSTGEYVGGISGLNREGGEIRYSINSGHVYGAGDFSYVGGMGARAYIGGIVGNNGTGGWSSSSGTIIECINNACVDCLPSNRSGGIVGYSYYGTGSIITNCVNSGYADHGIDPYSSGSYTINYGYVNNQNYVATYNLSNTNNVKQGLTYDEFREISNLSGFDFASTWYTNNQINNGLPMLQNVVNHLELNKCVMSMKIGDKFTLIPYLNDIEKSVYWETSNSTIASVSSNGIVTANATGVATITATTENGMKSNCCVYVYRPVTSIMMNKSETVIASGSNEAFTITQLPDGINETVTWTSDNTDIATVDRSGVVTAKKSGIAHITVKTTNTELSDTCTVTVIGKPITNIELSKTSSTLNVNETEQLTATITPSTNYQGDILWTSGNESVATVDSDGVITAKYPGKTYIYAEAESGVTSQCEVNVKAPSTEIEIDKSELNVRVGFTDKLKANMLPVYSTDSIAWHSSNTSIATVSSDGVITGVNKGQVMVTAVTESGKKASCTVNVIEEPILVNSVNIDQSDIILTLSDMMQLNGNTIPDNASNHELIWSSSDESIVSVNGTGVITANSVGTAIITATSDNGFYDNCIVKVISASGSSILLDDASVSYGGEAIVKARILKNPGISGYKFTIHYDENKLTPTSIIPNKDFGGEFTTNIDDLDRTELNVLWYNDSDIDISGDLFNIIFTANDDVEYGLETDVTIEYAGTDICNTKGEYIALYVDNAVVTFDEPMHGDIYEDGDINVYDITLLSRYITGLEVLTSRQFEAADVNNDGEVDIKDVVKMAQYLVGWTGVELMSVAENTDNIVDIDIGTVTANEIGEAEIPVFIKNNTGIAGFRYNIDYNNNEIEIIDIIPNEELLTNSFNTNLGVEDENGLLVSWYQESNMTRDGILFTIKARMKDTSNNASSEIRIVEADNNMCNQNIENVIGTYTSGCVNYIPMLSTETTIQSEDGKYILTSTLNHIADGNTVIVAAYDSNGELVGLKANDSSHSTVISEFEANENISYFKIMVWNDLKEIQPKTAVEICYPTK